MFKKFNECLLFPIALGQLTLWPLVNNDCWIGSSTQLLKMKEGLLQFSRKKITQSPRDESLKRTKTPTWCVLGNKVFLPFSSWYTNFYLYPRRQNCVLNQGSRIDPNTMKTCPSEFKAELLDHSVPKSRGLGPFSKWHVLNRWLTCLPLLKLNYRQLRSFRVQCKTIL